MGLELSGEGAVASGGAEVGDIIWLAQRKKIAEGGWTQLGRLRVAIAEALAAKGESWETRFGKVKSSSQARCNYRTTRTSSG